MGTTTTPRVNWCGWTFGVYSKEGRWRDVGGIYVFAGKGRDGRWRAIYVGKTGSFQDRIPFHEKWNYAVRLGATHVHAMAVSSAVKRTEIETTLINRLNPPLNQT